MENATATYSGWSVQTVNKSQMTSFLLLVESVMNRIAVLFLCMWHFLCRLREQTTAAPTTCRKVKADFTLAVLWGQGLPAWASQIRSVTECFL